MEGRGIQWLHGHPDPELMPLPPAGEVHPVLLHEHVHADAGGPDDRAVSTAIRTADDGDPRPRHLRASTSERFCPRLQTNAGYTTAIIGKWASGPRSFGPNNAALTTSTGPCDRGTGPLHAQ